MIPFSDPGTHFQLARFRIDHMLQDAENHRAVHQDEAERPPRRRRWRVRWVTRRRSLAS
ncbi:hypothetical protein [Actinoplanes italicus]|uniref:Uncharacterized protein n=1 Tax=Actinoplanes italicus TaxID=113567 RepID=A0A2T0KJA7_9ACTN|nr:hypothetical protein [Actinoplanes italicus]PRX23603.1 hypothetical protein CLV67_103352 [Actinoplanes italicus]